MERMTGRVGGITGEELSDLGTVREWRAVGWHERKRELERLGGPLIP